MIKYLNEYKLKQTLIRFSIPIFLVILLFPCEKACAQTSRIGIVNLLDSALVYKHIGLTGFKDKLDTFDCQFNCKKYIDKELTRILSSRYTISLISIPGSLISPNGNITISLNDNKEAQTWITRLKNQFDFIIFVETGEQDDIMDPKKQKLRSTGLYSRGNPGKSWVAVFNTTRYTAIRTSNLEIVNYDLSSMDYLLPINNYQFSKQDLLIDPGMLPLIRSELIRLIDYKLEFFLTDSYIMPNAEYNKLKPVKTE